MEWLSKPKEIVSFQQKPQIWRHFGGETILGIASTCVAIYSASVYSRVGFLLGATGAFFSFRHFYLDWQKKFINKLTLTPRRLSFSLGVEKQQREIPIVNIANMEVRYAHPRKGAIIANAAHYEFEQMLHLMKGEENISADCQLTLKDGEKITLRAGYFPEGTFVQFISYINEVLTNRVKDADKSVAKIRSKATEEEIYLSPEIQAIMQENQEYLQADIALKAQLEQAQQKAYEMLYVKRDEFDRLRMVGKTTLAQFTGADKKTIYFFKDDYKAGLEADEIEAGENLIQSAKENLALVNSRIESYQKVAQELQRLAAKEIKRQQLNRLAEDLKELQEQNTARSIEQQSLSNLHLPDADLSVLQELAKINEQIAGADTLEKTLLLKEHIALFKK
ncbi:hypothetical protein [Rhodoflexus sp.]